MCCAVIVRLLRCVYMLQNRLAQNLCQTFFYLGAMVRGWAIVGRGELLLFQAVGLVGLVVIESVKG